MWCSTEPTGSGWSPNTLLPTTDAGLALGGRCCHLGSRNPPAASVLPMKLIFTGEPACAVLTGAGLVSTAAPAWACRYGHGCPATSGGMCVSGAPTGDSVSPATSTGTGRCRQRAGASTSCPRSTASRAQSTATRTCIGLMESGGDSLPRPAYRRRRVKSGTRVTVNYGDPDYINSILSCLRCGGRHVINYCRQRT